MQYRVFLAYDCEELHEELHGFMNSWAGMGFRLQLILESTEDGEYNWNDIDNDFIARFDSVNDIDDIGIIAVCITYMDNDDHTNTDRDWVYEHAALAFNTPALNPGVIDHINGFSYNFNNLADRFRVRQRSRHICDNVRTRVITADEGCMYDSPSFLCYRAYTELWRNKFPPPPAVSIAFDYLIPLEGFNNTTPSVSESWDNHRRAMEAHGGLVTRGARISQQRREAEGRDRSWRCDWDNKDYWLAPSQDPGVANYITITAADDYFLWQTVTWILNNYENLHLIDTGNQHVDTIAAQRWLYTRTTFRSLIKEYARRQLTLEPKLYKLLQDILGTTIDGVSVTPPWKDPALRHQRLDNFLDEPDELIDPNERYGRDYRRIDLD